jgi:hypothetical protein
MLRLKLWILEEGEMFDVEEEAVLKQDGQRVVGKA